MTTISNISKGEKCDFKCCRGSVFGNPFEIGRDGTRREVIVKYKKWFYFLIRSKFIQDQLKLMKGKILGCFCKSLDGTGEECHCEVIVDYLDNKL